MSEYADVWECFCLNHLAISKMIFIVLLGLIAQ